jgi:hypothetical protein
MPNSFSPSNWYWLVAGNTTQVWSSASNAFVPLTNSTYEAWLSAGNAPTNVPSVGSAMGAVIDQTGLLDDSDTTMHRVAEAVALGLNTWTGADVVAWVSWRRALRAIISGSDTTSTSIPTKPAYPAGT